MRKRRDKETGDDRTTTTVVAEKAEGRMTTTAAAVGEEVITLHHLIKAFAEEDGAAEDFLDALADVVGEVVAGHPHNGKVDVAVETITHENGREKTLEILVGEDRVPDRHSWGEMFELFSRSVFDVDSYSLKCDLNFCRPLCLASTQESATWVCCLVKYEEIYKYLYSYPLALVWPIDSFSKARDHDCRNS